jgi:hypothetical protein
MSANIPQNTTDVLCVAAAAADCRCLRHRLRFRSDLRDAARHVGGLCAAAFLPAVATLDPASASGAILRAGRRLHRSVKIPD